jgi:hypothetical protein
MNEFEVERDHTRSRERKVVIGLIAWFAVFILVSSVLVHFFGYAALG